MENNNLPTTPIAIMQPPVAPQSPKRKLSKKRLVIIGGIVVVLLIGLGVGLYLVHRAQLISEVKVVLSQVDNDMRGVGSDGAAFPRYIPSDISSDKVLLGGGGSFDGTAFCVTGTSKSDASVVYHISSGDNGVMKEGACPVTNDQNATLSAPTGLAIAAIESGVVSINWHAVKDATGYTLQCATDTAFTKDVAETVSATTQGFCTNLKGSTTYYVRVAAKNDSKTSDWSSAITATTHDASIAPDLTLTLENGNVNYSWNAVSGATQYLLEWATDTSFMQNVQQKTLTTTSGTATGLKSNTVYYFHVKAITGEFDANHASFSEPEDVLVK